MSEVVEGTNALSGSCPPKHWVVVVVVVVMVVGGGGVDIPADVVMEGGFKIYSEEIISSRGFVCKSKGKDNRIGTAVRYIYT